MRKQELKQSQRDDLLELLQKRFEDGSQDFGGLEWPEIRQRLEAAPAKLWSLQQMEETGGEPALVDVDEETAELIFCDCSPETPAGRRSLCYDDEALEARKKNKPEGSARGMAARMGVELLTEGQYRMLQDLREFDRSTSSWIQTPERIRKLGGALFCDRRYDTVFVYHNGADSYYSSRGFRGILRV